MEKQQANSSGPQGASEASQSDKPIHRRNVLSSEHHNVDTAVDWLEELAAEQNLNEDLLNRLLVAASEAVTNSLRHGNQYDPVKEVVIDVTFYAASIEVVVEDEGTGFEPSALDDPLQQENLTKEGGRGVYLMEQLTDEVRFEEGGCRVYMRFEM